MSFLALLTPHMKGELNFSEITPSMALHLIWPITVFISLNLNTISLTRQ